MNPRYRPLLRLASTSREVFVATCAGAQDFGRIVVLKRVREMRTEAWFELRKEGLIGAQLNHPNVVYIQDLSEERSGLTLVAQYVPGVNLRNLLSSVHARHGRVDWAVGARIAADIAAGLAHAHRAEDASGRALGIVHRDISPKNLLLSESGFGVVADFGIAQVNYQPDADRTQVKGTPGYLSPEQASGAFVDWRSDVFSLGVVLFEILAGEALAVSDPQATWRRAAQVHAMAALDHVPSSIQTLLRQMLAVDADRRRITMDEIAEVLGTTAAATGVGHRAVSQFLGAEMSPVLIGRRRRIAQLLANLPAVPPSDQLPYEHPTLTEDTGQDDTYAELGGGEDRTDIDFGSDRNR